MPSTVFDLPQSTVPDAVKQVGNLPQRNLIRSSKIELASAEDLLELYGIMHQHKLTPEQVERDAEKRKLFQVDNLGKYRAGNHFRTPLWYYILKEAEYFSCGGKLGRLGGRIIAEVIAGGIYYLNTSFVHTPSWNSKITGNRHVRFSDFVNFVTE